MTKSFFNKFLNIYGLLGLVILICGLSVIIVPSIPQLWYVVNQEATAEEVQSITGAVEQIDTEPVAAIELPTEELRLPSLDPSLPQKNIINIPKIGVNSEIYQGKNAESQLKKGVWLTYGWGTPSDQVPTILAAHRFGYITWSNNFRRTNSFYNLPKLNKGDEVEIIWEQRMYIYKVTSKTTDTEIRNLDADLVLYTCKLLNSPERIILYLERTN